MANLILQNVTKSFGDVDIIQGVDLQVETGEFIVFVGPSGCGKSTLLRMIAGLEDVTSGAVIIDNENVNDVIPAERGVAMVFQSYALYPHMTVFDNMAFGLRQAKLPKEDIKSRVHEAAESLQLTPLLERLPKQLSGGQRQRVAIGRAIVRKPKIFLFDEPLSNLDAALRVQTRIEIAKLHTQLDATMIYVTHDQVEAMTLADKIVVLNGGFIEQVGTPLELYHTPRNLFVAQFIGSPQMNILKLKANKDGFAILSSGDKIPAKHIHGQVAHIGVRPEHLVLMPADKAFLSGKINHIEHLGEYTIAYINLADDTEITAKIEDEHQAEVGQDVTLGADISQLHFFDGDGMALARQKA